jgi:hypothetical protein
MNDLIKVLLTNKGTRSYRTALIAIVSFVAWKIQAIEQRLSALESRVPPPHYGAATVPDHASVP